jgi:hypothetical protein
MGGGSSTVAVISSEVKVKKSISEDHSEALPLPVSIVQSPSIVNANKSEDKTIRKVSTAEKKIEVEKSSLKISVNIKSKYDSEIVDSKIANELLLETAWLCNQPDWMMCMDEEGNTFYYNKTTKESSWNAPKSTALVGFKELKVTVPTGIKGGEVFSIDNCGHSIDVMCPQMCTSNMKVLLKNISQEENPDGSISNKDACQPFTDEDNNFNGDKEDTESKVNANYDNNYKKQSDDLELLDLEAYYEPIDGDDDNDENKELGEEDEFDFENLEYELTSITSTSILNKKIEKVSDETVWSVLANTAHCDLYAISNDAKAALTILQEVSHGSYAPELIFQLSWAYKFNLLKEAAKDCYLSGGNFFDSSNYDNCSGTPRYEKQGFIEWLQDLQAQRSALLQHLQSGRALSHQEAAENSLFYDKTQLDYANLELLALAGDDKNFFGGLIDRRKRVEVELDQLRCRFFSNMIYFFKFFFFLITL